MNESFLDNFACGLEVADVVLHEVDAPIEKRLDVLFFITLRTNKTSAGFWPHRRVDTELQTPGVEIVSECFHVREVCIGLEDAVQIPLSFPTIVNVDVLIPGLRHSVRDHGIGL